MMQRLLKRWSVGAVVTAVLAMTGVASGQMCDCSLHGDVAGNDGVINLLDITALIDHAFMAGPAPPTDGSCPHLNRGDFDCDDRINLVDVVRMVDFVFRAGDGPCQPCRPGVGMWGLLYVLNQTDRTVYVYDTETLLRVDSFPAQMVEPHFVTFSYYDAGYFIISRAHNGLINKFDVNNNAFVASGSHNGVFPTAMAIALIDGRQYGYVADFSAPGEITKFYKFYLRDMTVVDSVQAGAMSHDIETSPDGSLIVGTNMGDLITMIYPDADTVFQVPIDPDSLYTASRRKYGPYGVQFHPNGQFAYIACLHSAEVAPQVRVLDVVQRRIVDSVHVPIRPTTQTPAAPCQLDITPDGATLFVTTQWGNSILAIRTSDLAVVADIPTAMPNTFGVDITPDGRRVYVAAAGAPNQRGRVYILDGTTLEKIDSLDVGRNPFGLGWHPPNLK